MDVVQFSMFITTDANQNRTNTKYLTSNIVTSRVTGIKLASVQHNLTQTSVPHKEGNVFLIKFNLECSGLALVAIE